MRLQIGAMSAGDILDRGLKLLLSRLPTFYAINLLAFAPLLLAQLLFPDFWMPGARPQDNMRFLGARLLLLGATVALQPAVAAATLYVVARAFTDLPASVGGAFAFALRHFFKLLFASILFGIIVMAGAAMCCVPGILFGVWFAFVGQAVALEGRNPGRALARSMELTEGYRWRVFGVTMLLGLGFYVSGILASTVNLALPQGEIVPTEGGIEFLVNYQNYFIGLVTQTLVNILVQTYAAVCMTLLYLDLRIRKEGLDLELAARQQASLV